MTNLIILIILMALNIYYGVRDVKNNKMGWSGAFTWFVVGWLAMDIVRIMLL